MDEEKKIPDVLLKLIEGCSTYFKLSIKYWLAIAIFSLVIIISVDGETDKIKMPFELGELSKTDFYPLGFVIISILTIAFGASLSQGSRAYELAKRVIKKINDDYIFYDSIHLRDIADALFYPSLSRVAPLAQALQGKNQFFPESKNVPKRLKALLVVYYAILKIVAIIVMFLFPAFALIVSFVNSDLCKLKLKWDIPTPIFWVVGLISLSILSQLLVFEVKLLFRRYHDLQDKKS